jgi:hypothetical protein
MSDDRADLILNMLRAIRAEQSAQREKLDEIINRLGALERGVAALSLRIAEIRVDFAGLSVRIDNLDRRVRRIERRLDLVDVPASGLSSGRTMLCAWRVPSRTRTAKSLRTICDATTKSNLPPASRLLEG